MTGPACRILGVDPGSRKTGYGVIDLVQGQPVFVTCGVITANPQHSLALRVKEIHDGIVEVIARYKPGVAVVEEVFLARNAQSALKLGHARGAILVAVMQPGIEIFEYSALHIKQAIVGYGRAEKGQVQHMVRILLQLTSKPSEDAADALAAALCHSQRWRLDSLM